MEARIAEIKAMKWRDIQDLAESFDPPLQKGDDEQWKDLAEEIALAESKLSGSNPEVAISEEDQIVEVNKKVEQDHIPDAGKKDYSFTVGRDARQCVACGRPVTTGLDGKLICPVADINCPRN